MRRTNVLFCLLGSAGVLSACGGDDSGIEADGSADGDVDGSSDGSAGSDDGVCGKGLLQSGGEAKFCSEADAESSCRAIADAKGYTDVDGDIYVQGVDDLSPLACLADVGQLTISDAEGLTNLTGLGSLVTVGTLGLRDNPDLESLAGLDSLRTFSTLNLVGNGLESLRGLAAGTTVKNLYIESHEALTSLAGLENLAVTTALVIQNNPLLPQCEAEAFAARFPGVNAVLMGNDSLASCE